MVRGSPNEEKLKKGLLLFNELTVIYYLLVLMTLSDYNTSFSSRDFENEYYEEIDNPKTYFRLFDILAIVLISIIVLAFLVNLIVVIWTFLKWLCLKIR